MLFVISHKPRPNHKPHSTHTDAGHTQAHGTRNAAHKNVAGGPAGLLRVSKNAASFCQSLDIRSSVGYLSIINLSSSTGIQRQQPTLQHTTHRSHSHTSEALLPRSTRSIKRQQHSLAREANVAGSLPHPSRGSGQVKRRQLCFPQWVTGRSPLVEQRGPHGGLTELARAHSNSTPASTAKQHAKHAAGSSAVCWLSTL